VASSEVIAVSSEGFKEVAMLDIPGREPKMEAAVD
jgi:hypothetical protein